MFHELEKSITEQVADYVRGRYGLETQAALEQPKNAAFGELAIAMAFALARQLKRAPRKIAEEFIAGIGTIDGVAALEIAGNGYINVRLDRGAYGASILKGADPEAAAAGGKIIVEHTNINPNKSAHIGHLRNAILGDTFVRMLRARGRRVEVQNYIDNTGVQVADVVVAFLKLENRTLAQVEALSRAERFDYLCWDVYAGVSQYFAAHEEAAAWRRETLHAIEAEEGDAAAAAHLVADSIVAAHLKTMLRLGVSYDVLPRESEILHLQFWAAAFERLKERGAIYLETEGKNSGCWVMPSSAFKTASEEGADDSKVIVRSNGTVTYVGKDIAYQLWKFGLLGKDFHYRPLGEFAGHTVYVSAASDGEEGVHFGGGEWVYNVIDSRQSYLQDVVVAGLRALGYEDQARRSVHFSYEMVALSPRTCVEMGIELSEDDKKKPYVEVSGRKGLGVKADDLIDKLIEKAGAEVDSRHADAPEEERREVASRIAVGALRYFMLKYTRNSVIAFDLHEALSFEGETGPYVQYAAVRARNIFRKLAERGEALPDFAAQLSAESMARHLAGEDLWQHLLLASKADSIIERAVASGEPAHVAKYAFQLAQSFSNFYHGYKVLSEQDSGRRTFLLWMTQYFQIQLERTLTVLGIEAPVYM